MLSSSLVSLSVCCQSWLKYSVLSHHCPSSLGCRLEMEEGRQPASIQLFLSYWYSGHTESSSVSAVRAKEECRKWGNGEQRSGVSPLHPMLCGPKNRQHPPFFSNPSASLFSHPASFLISPSSPSPSFSSLFLCKHPLWCPLITPLQCNPRQVGPYKQSRLDEGLTLGAVYFNTTVFSRLLRQN